MDFKALGKKAAETGSDMTKQKSGEGGGGEYVPPAEGPCRLRFIGYIEIGKHKKMMKGVEQINNEARCLFEISGPKHPAREHDGKKFPHIAIVKLNTVSKHEKSTMVKLFNILNYAGTAASFFELLGEGYLGTIRHRKYKRRDDTEGIAIELTDVTGALQIRPPRFADPETGDMRVVSVDPVVGPMRGFMWDYADKATWDTLFIDGEYEARKDKDGKITAPAKSKNEWQNLIKSAVNFKGSPIHQLLGGGELDLENVVEEEGEDVTAAIPDTPPATPQGAAADDALSGIA